MTAANREHKPTVPLELPPLRPAMANSMPTHLQEQPAIQKENTEKWEKGWQLKYVIRMLCLHGHLAKPATANSHAAKIDRQRDEMPARCRFYCQQRVYTLKSDPKTRSRMQTAALRRKLTKHRVRLRNQHFEVSTGPRAPTATTPRNFITAGVKGRLSGFRCKVGVAEVSSGALAGAHNAARTVESIESCLAEGDAKTCIRH